LTKSHLNGLLFAGGLLTCASPVLAEDLLVVTPTTVSQSAMDRPAVAALFLGRRQASNLIPIDQKDETLRQRFYRDVADMSLASVRAFWAKQIFTGRGRPPARLSAEEIQKSMSHRPPIITYVPDGQLPPGGKALLAVSSGEQP
jgi:hypothetical protein